MRRAKVQPEDSGMEEIERKTKLKETMESLNKLIEKMDRKKDEMLEKARAAMARGSQTSLNLAKVGLANALSTRKRAEEMLLQLDIMSSMRDITELTKGFLSVVSETCGEIQAFSKGNNFNKVSKEMAKAFEAVNEQSDGIAELMESSSMSMDALNFNFSGELQDEVDALIGGTAAAAENAMDDEITAKIERLKRTE